MYYMFKGTFPPYDPIGLPNKVSIEEIEDILLAINICESNK